MSFAAQALAALAGQKPDESERAAPFLHDLTAQARAGRLSPVVGRDSEILQVLEVASQKRKPNAVLIGPAGAGKTAVAEGLAQLCAHHGQNLPASLRGLRVLQLDVGAVMAGAGVFGEIEKRMGQVLREARQEQVLLFIDELHTLVGAGGRAGHNDVAQWLKPHLARGELRVLAATTAEEYHQIIARDGAFERRFSPIYVQPMNDAAALRACETHARWLQLATPPKRLRPVLRQIVQLARRLLRHRAMPDAAIDLLERSVAVAALAGQPLSARHAALAAARLLHLPDDLAQRLQQLQRGQGLAALDADLRPSVASAAAQLLGRLGLRGTAPAGMPPGQGACLVSVGGAATRGEQVAAALANALGTAVVALDGQLTEREIYGSEPGYVGYGQRRAIHRLHELPFSVVHLCHADGGPSSDRLKADLRAGAFTDTEGRVMPVHVAVLSSGGATARGPIGFTPHP